MNMNRYEARVITGKRSWKKLDIIDNKAFGVWDNDRDEWWKGKSQGAVTWKIWANTVERAAALNANTYVSSYQPPESPDHGLVRSARFWHGDQRASAWFTIDTVAHVGNRYYNPAGVDTRTLYNDNMYSIVSFYYNSEGKWDPVSRTYEYTYEPRDDWAIQIVDARRVNGMSLVEYEGNLSLLDFLTDYWGFCETVRLDDIIGDVDLI